MILCKKNTVNALYMSADDSFDISYQCWVCLTTSDTSEILIFDHVIEDWIQM